MPRLIHYTHPAQQRPGGNRPAYWRLLSREPTPRWEHHCNGRTMIYKRQHLGIYRHAYNDDGQYIHPEDYERGWELDEEALGCMWCSALPPELCEIVGTIRRMGSND